MAIGGRIRVEVLTRDGFACVYCGARSLETQLHVDHVVPKHEGGSDAFENYVTACRDCNLGKGKRGLTSARETSAIVSGAAPRFLFEWSPAELVRRPWLRMVTLLAYALQSRWDPYAEDSAVDPSVDADVAEYEQIVRGIVELMVEGVACARGDGWLEDIHLTEFAQMVGWAQSLEDLSQRLLRHVTYWRGALS